MNLLMKLSPMKISCIWTWMYRISKKNSFIYFFKLPSFLCLVEQKSHWQWSYKNWLNWWLCLRISMSSWLSNYWSATVTEWNFCKLLIEFKVKIEERLIAPKNYVIARLRVKKTTCIIIAYQYKCFQELECSFSGLTREMDLNLFWSKLISVSVTQKIWSAQSWPLLHFFPLRPWP
jgi:hypothetical protein